MHTILNDNINSCLAKKCLEECPHAFSSCLRWFSPHVRGVFSFISSEGIRKTMTDLFLQGNTILIDTPSWLILLRTDTNTRIDLKVCTPCLFLWSWFRMHDCQQALLPLLNILVLKTNLRWYCLMSKVYITYILPFLLRVRLFWY